MNKFFIISLILHLAPGVTLLDSFLSVDGPVGVEVSSGQGSELYYLQVIESNSKQPMYDNAGSVTVKKQKNNPRKQPKKVIKKIGRLIGNSHSTTNLIGSSGRGQGRTMTALESYIYRLQKTIENASFQSDRLSGIGEVGTVEVYLELNNKGEVLGINIKSSSGSKFLDITAENLVKDLEPYEDFPKEVDVSSLRFTVPINFQ